MVLSLLFLSATAVAVAGGAAAAPDRSAASASATWLAGRFAEDGTLQNPLGGALPDHGLMIDTVLALYAAGRGESAAPALDYLEQHASDYYTLGGLIPDQGFEAIITGGAAAKTLVLAEVAGRDPRTFGGNDMVAETRAAIMRSGPDRGRVSDYSKNPDYADFVSNNANMFGQSLAVIGLAGAGANDQLAIDKMLTQQCSDGYFRVFFGYIKTDEVGDHVNSLGYKVSSCDEGLPFDQSSPDGDTTGMALSAMLAARAAGAAGLDAPITRAVEWLRGNQSASGGWGGGVGTEAPNSNSTGLIVQALADEGSSPSQVDKGLAYLKSVQVSAADAGTALGESLGAIAYNTADFAAARADGITGVDTWIRATAQASLGLSQVGFHDLTLGRVPDGEDPPTTSPTTPPTTAPPTTTTAPPTATPPPGADDQPPAATPPVSDKAGTPAPRPGAPRGKAVVPPAPLAEPGSASPQGALGRYLAGNLVDGDHVEVTEDGTTFVDYDATADLVLGLRTLGEQPEATARASRFLLDPASIAAYAHGAGYEQGPAAYAEPLAKLRVVAGFLRGEGTGPADLDQVTATLRVDLAALRAPDGTFTDTGSFADTTTSTRRHAWATLATVADSAADAGAPLDLLIGHQCQDGTFPTALGTGDCATGDLAATATALFALNAKTAGTGQPQGIRSGGAQEGWSTPRTTALLKAAGALNTKPDAEGLVAGVDSTADPVLSAVVAGGRQVAGLDATATSRTLRARLLDDGGAAETEGAGSDLLTSIALAPGVAGSAWPSAPHSPVEAALRLPLPPGPAAAAAVAPQAQAETTRLTFWPVVGLVGLGFLLAVAVLLGLRPLLTRIKNRKAVSP